MAISKHVILAAGHGGTDPGSTGQGTTEREECIKLVNETASRLRADKRIKVTVVPHSLGLRDTIAWVNARFSNINQAVAIEVHKNCCNASGTETWYYGGSDSSKTLASKFQNALAKYVKTRNRGVKPDTSNRHGRLGFVRDTNTWALLAEAGFIKGETLKTAKHSEGLYRGTLALWGLTKPAPPPPPPAPTTDAKVLQYRKNFVLTGGENYKTVAGAEFINLLNARVIKKYRKGDEFTAYSTFKVGDTRYYTTEYSHKRIMKENYLGAIEKGSLEKPNTSLPPTPPIVIDYPKEPEVDIKKLEQRLSLLETIVEGIIKFLKAIKVYKGD